MAINFENAQNLRFALNSAEYTLQNTIDEAVERLSGAVDRIGYIMERESALDDKGQSITQEVRRLEMNLDNARLMEATMRVAMARALYQASIEGADEAEQARIDELEAFFKNLRQK